jgi:NAD+ kinase
MILPDSAKVKVVVPLDSRYPAWASFDGKHRIQLNHGDSITISKSPLNMLTIDPRSLPCSSCNWFKKLSNTLHWNVRARQRGTDLSEEAQMLENLNRLFSADSS